MSSLPTITPRVSLPLPRFRELTPEEDIPEDHPTQSRQAADLESDNESNASDDMLRSVQPIPQPSGQPGRPGSGGYSIEDALKAWSKEELAKVMTLTKTLADARLDQSMSYSKQDKAKVNTLCETVLSLTMIVARNYPIVGKYEDCWPVRGILKLHLKAKSETFRRGINQQRGTRRSNGD
ncbi:hypothetical protein GALMADRAFT_210576 [Galerina marginata CBS 339.88]|uniref:Uncharacterized protein n=1 Tax=Galerina marginata (strain CBS 339.88) TaxID=685588 RepID=A0A067T2V1_GALM3|nr:hypothetical protein GALMADRAFT_210576 [Galerina marginata CBS 339.88]